MKILILGGTGMLGHKLVQTLGRDFETWTTIRRPFSGVDRFGIFDRDRTIDGLDVEDYDALIAAVRKVKPHMVVNAVGIVKQIAAPKELNSILPHKLAEMSREFGFKLISISTDCVFSGKKGNYTEIDTPDADDDYGQSKARGEVTGENCLTIRTSIIGRELDTPHSLVEWLLSNRGGKVNGFTKVIYTGFPTNVFAGIISEIISKHPALGGLYHISSDPIRKFDLLKLIDKYYDTGIEILPSEDIINDRSLDSSRFRSATGFEPTPWDEMIRQMAADPTPYERFHDIA